LAVLSDADDIGLPGGAGWPSAIAYWRILNEPAQRRPGGFHSAKLILRNIDYHDLKSRTHDGRDEIPALLEKEGWAARARFAAASAGHQVYDGRRFLPAAAGRIRAARHHAELGHVFMRRLPKKPFEPLAKQ
jgi:hypothetical protein